MHVAEIWRNKYGIPRYSVIPDDDNKLFVDWESKISLLSFLSVVKNRDVITISEFLFEEENAIARKGNNIFPNECIMTFYKDHTL